MLTARPMFSPSRACTVSTSICVFGVLLAAVVYTCSRVSYSSTLSTSGAMRCTPGYKVPGRAPQSWLTRTPPNPSGTTAMLKATRSGSTPANASRWASPKRTGTAEEPDTQDDQQVFQDQHVCSSFRSRGAVTESSVPGFRRLRCAGQSLVTAHTSAITETRASLFAAPRVERAYKLCGPANQLGSHRRDCPDGGGAHQLQRGAEHQPIHGDGCRPGENRGHNQHRQIHQNPHVASRGSAALRSAVCIARGTPGQI